MDLTTIHIALINNGLSRLVCYDCDIFVECQSRGITFCKEIGEWLKERVEVNN